VQTKKKFQNCIWYSKRNNQQSAIDPKKVHSVQWNEIEDVLNGKIATSYLAVKMKTNQPPYIKQQKNILSIMLATKIFQAKSILKELF
jgi:hypothetical protein